VVNKYVTILKNFHISWSMDLALAVPDFPAYNFRPTILLIPLPTGLHITDDTSIDFLEPSTRPLDYCLWII
jgi:hypothetical protein